MEKLNIELSDRIKRIEEEIKQIKEALNSNNVSEEKAETIKPKTNKDKQMPLFSVRRVVEDSSEQPLPDKVNELEPKYNILVEGLGVKKIDF